MSEERISTALTVGESDSAAIRGVQADLKTFAAFGVYGTCAVTAVAAGNTVASGSAIAMTAEAVAAQVSAIVADIGAGAVKTGALVSEETVRAVASQIREHGLDRVVADPVLVDAKGEAALPAEAVEAYKSELLPTALLATPNIPEAQFLTGIKIRNMMGMKAAAKLISRMGPRYVLVTGGHLEGEEVTDVLFNGNEYYDFPGERIDVADAAGAGCALSAAITAGLARGRPVEEAVAVAKMYVAEALRAALRMGKGGRPLNHMYGWWSRGGAEGWGG